MDDPLDKATVVPVFYETPWFELVADTWPDRETARYYRDVLHSKDIQRASQPPVINVTVPGIPGHFTAAVGTTEVAYSTGDSAPAGAGVTFVGRELGRNE